METRRGRGAGGGSGAVSERGGGGGRASARGCGRQARAGRGALAADAMDSHGDCAAGTPAAEQPSGRINKAAFKLFKKRKSGGTMPSIFGVKNKGDGKSPAPAAGMVRSRTHDGLAEAAAPEGGRKESARGGAEGAGGRPGAGCPGPGAVAKSHSFFSLLRKNGRAAEGGRAEAAEAGRAGGKQRRGLRGILSGMRWPRKDKRGAGAEPPARAAPGGLGLPGSLTASLECVQEEPPRAGAARPPDSPGRAAPRGPAGEPGGEQVPAAAAAPARARLEAPSPGGPQRRGARAQDPAAADERTAEDARGPGAAAAHAAPPAAPEGGRRGPAAPPAADPPSDPSADRICLMFSDVTSLKSFDSLTGCGDIIADQEAEAGPSCGRPAPAPGEPAGARRSAGVVAYQGGGEEMASPDGADDAYLQEFWDMLSQSEEPAPRPPEAAAALDSKAAPEAAKEARGAEAAARDAASVKRRRLNRIPVEPPPKEEPKPGKEPPEGVPNSDEGYWDSTTPGPEEDGASGDQKAGLPRDSDSGDALYDLCADPEGSPAAPPAPEETACLSRLKPVSPGTITCPLRTPSSLLKDSKIPISVKHLANLPSSHPVAHLQPARSELPRTKIPVSKVLVRRVSNRGLAGSAIRAAACHDSAKKL
ncbi:APC membrane recruitment protein 2 isoform 1-T1 [Ctenodactylus gundi]